MYKKLVFTSILYLLFTGPVLAAPTACEVSVNKNSLTAADSDSLIFSIRNTDEGGNLVYSVKITSPSDNFSITSGDGPSLGVVTIDDTHREILIRTSLSSGETGEFAIGITTGDSTQAAASFGVQTSLDREGADGVGCTGETGVAITGGSSAINISHITVSASDTSAKISWTTSIQSTGVINYGLDTQYGLTANDTTQGTSHNVNLTGLSAQTAYHFRVTGTDQEGNSTQTNDNSFTTATSGGVEVTTTTVQTTVSTIVEVKDTAVPGVFLTSDLSKPYAQAPQIFGKVTDSGGVSQVEYSIDNGRNWLPVDQVTNRYATSTSFSFLPTGLLDGNYTIRIRAKDATGNVGFSRNYVLIIDRLPPQPGLILWTYGPQVLSSTTLVGMKVKVNLSSVGGPVAIQLNSNKLEKNPETGLWSGDLVFTSPGDYPINIEAVDGAKNKTSTTLGNIQVLPRGNLGSKGEILVYYFESTQSKFVLWDGGPFGQLNPVATDDEGNYELVLPDGKYYLEAKASGKRTARTTIFSLNRSTVVNMNFNLKSRFLWWPFLQIDNVAWNTTQSHGDERVEKTELPFFVLPNIDGELVYGSSLRGVPTVLTLVSSWVPSISGQLAELEKVSRNKNYRALVVFVQENISKSKIFSSRGGYGLPTLVDVDGEMLKTLNISNVPSHLFINRQGQMTKIVSGPLSSDQIISHLKNSLE